jgi:hypothetical protein
MLLAGCAQSPLLDTVEGKLADEALDEAEPAARLYVAVSGLVGETFAVESVNGYVFEGECAAALGAVSADVTTGNDTLTWSFDGVGLDGADGHLLITTDLDRASFDVQYDAGDVAMAVTLTNQHYDADTNEGIVGGTGTWSIAGAGRTISALGPAPYPGLAFSPSTALAPSSGQVHWANEDEDLKMLLDDASEIDAAAGTWPGTITGGSWEREIEVRLP